MIVSSHARKDPQPIASSTVQIEETPVKTDQDAFSLVLALLNQVGEATVDGESVLPVEIGELQAVEATGRSALADQHANAAKIAAWLLANPASAAQLSALAGSFYGLPESAALKALQLAGNLQADPGLGMLDTAPGAQYASQQGLSRAELLSAAVNASAQRLGQFVSLAGQGHVQSGINGAAALPPTSNRLLEHSIFGNLSLSEALSLAAAKITVPHESPNLVALTASQGIATNVAIAGGFEREAATSDLPLAASTGAEVRGEAGLDAVANALEIAAVERHSEQVIASDALLRSGSDLTPKPSGLQQLSSATSLARASLENASALEGSVSWLASQQGGAATIDLSPPDLGSLRLELKIDAAGESASLVVHAANDAARAAIEQSLDRLYESFQASGMSLQVSVGSGSSAFAQNFAQGLNSGIEFSRADARLSDSRPEAATPPSRGLTASDALSLYA